MRIQLNHGHGEGREGKGKAKLCPGLPFPLRAKFQTHLMISNFFFFLSLIRRRCQMLRNIGSLAGFLNLHFQKGDQAFCRMVSDSLRF